MRQRGFIIAAAGLLFGLATHTAAAAAEIKVLAAAAIDHPFEPSRTNSSMTPAPK
jgi:hypothetical protein